MRFWPGWRVFFFGWPKYRGVELRGKHVIYPILSPLSPRPGYESRTGPEGPGAHPHEAWGYSKRA